MSRLDRVDRLAFLLATCGLLWAAQAVLDSFRLSGAILGPLLVVAALLLQLARGRPFKGYVVTAVLALAYGASAPILIEFRADSASYFAYLRSLSFDADLDFANEWNELGIPDRRPQEKGSRKNVFSVGPALLWSPFYAAAHAYVRLDRFLGRELYPPDGYSLPYRRATQLGTVTIVVLGATLLTLTLTRSLGFGVAMLAVAGAFFTSPVLYYTVWVPAMAHGVSFAAASGLLWAWDRARREPSLVSWIVLGSVLGLVTLCRWQGAAYVLLVAPLAIQGLLARTVRPSWVAAGAGVALLVFGPQMLAWKLMFGRFVLIPQGRGFLEWSSPNWLNTLISADHGFLNWTPSMWVGLAGLVLGLGRAPLLHGGGLAVFAATAWINGSVPGYDWAAGDAYGARRYSLVVPLVALGLGRALDGSQRLLRRAPLVAPATALVMMSLWNLGFISHFRARQYPEMAPLERLAKDQAGSLRRLAQDILGLVAGERGRALAYKYFSAEYFYTGFNRSGTINLRSADDRYLLNGWHTPSRRIARRTFRRALYPEACVRIPLEKPFRLRVTVSARAPEGIARQEMTLAMNGSIVSSARLETHWRRIAFVVPREDVVPGENRLCLRFSSALPDEGDGKRIAAHVERIQLP